MERNEKRIGLSLHISPHQKKMLTELKEKLQEGCPMKVTTSGLFRHLIEQAHKDLKNDE